MKNAVYIINTDENARSANEEITENPFKINYENALEKVTEKSIKKRPRMEPNGEHLIHHYSRFQWWGAVLRRVALFYRVRRKRVFIAMGNENFDFATLHFASHFNEIPPGTPGGSQDSPGLLLEVSKALPWTCLGFPRTP